MTTPAEIASTDAALVGDTLTVTVKFEPDAPPPPPPPPGPSPATDLILSLGAESLWPLITDDPASTVAVDLGPLANPGKYLGGAKAGVFDGELGSVVEVPHRPNYSPNHPLTVMCWIRPKVLDFRHWDGTSPVSTLHDTYTEFVAKGMGSSDHVEFTLRMRNHTAPPSVVNAISAYAFNNRTHNTGEGNSSDTHWVVRVGEWTHVVGQFEQYDGPNDIAHGMWTWRDGRRAPDSKGRTWLDNTSKQNHVVPFSAPYPLHIGGFGRMAFEGDIAHVATFPRLLAAAEIAAVVAAGV